MQIQRNGPCLDHKTNKGIILLSTPLEQYFGHVRKSITVKTKFVEKADFVRDKKM